MPVFGMIGEPIQWQQVLEDIIVVGYFQMGSVGGTGDSISAWIRMTTGAHLIKYAIYDNGQNLIANGVTEEEDYFTGENVKVKKLLNFVGTKPILVADAWYYLAAWAEATGGVCKIYFESDTGDGVFFDAHVYNGFHDPFVKDTTKADHQLGISCSYTETIGVDSTLHLNLGLGGYGDQGGRLRGPGNSTMASRPYRRLH